MANEKIGRIPVESWLSGQRAKTCCSCCGSVIESRNKEKSNSGQPVCRNCRSAMSRIAKARTEFEVAIAANESQRKRRELERERDARKQVMELRQSEGETLEMIVAGNAALPHELENYFNEIGWRVGRKKELYGMMASELQEWFSPPQIQLLCFLFWRAFHANPRNYDVVAARRGLLRRIKSATD